MYNLLKNVVLDVLGLNLVLTNGASGSGERSMALDHLFDSSYLK